MPSTEKFRLVPGRLLFLVSIFLFLLALSAPQNALADQAVIKEAVVNLRAAPGTGSTIVGKAAQGERLEVLSKQGDWYRVIKNGIESWVAGWLVSLEQAPAQSQAPGLGQAVVKEPLVNLRAAPGTDSAIVGKAAKGERLEILSKQGDWYRVIKNGTDSWVAGWLVEVSREPVAYPYGDGGSGAPETSGAAPTAEMTAARAEVTESGVNIRSGPGTGFRILGQAVAGSQYDVADKSGGWYKISGGSVSGWISDQFVKISTAAASRGAAERPSPVSGVAVVKGSEVNIRSGPGTNYNVLSSANRGQRFLLVDKANDWYKVKLDNNRSGWVVAWLVDVDRPPAQGNEGSPANPGQNKGPGTPAESGAQNGTGIIPPPPQKEPEKGEVTTPPKTEEKKQNGLIKSVSAVTEGDNTVVMIKSDGKPMKYSVTTALNPDRIVVDISDFEPGSAPEKINFKSSLIDGVRVGLNSRTPAVTRVVVDLGRVVKYEKSLSSDGTQLKLKIMPRTEKSLKGAKIVLDPGHGGSDPGAIGPSGLKEKTVNLDIAQKAAQILRNQGATVLMTRTTDTYVDLYSRPQMAEKMGADLFVSIHNNASTSTKAAGTSTYYRRSDDNGMDLVRLEGVYLSRTIQKNLMGTLKRSDLGVLQADFVVIAKSKVPAALAEIAFISNPEEEKLLAGESFRMKAATAIAQGIADYLKLK
ncbi:MAG: SH3 domain-containing protein [Bacillota bacterium]